MRRLGAPKRGRLRVLASLGVLAMLAGCGHIGTTKRASDLPGYPVGKPAAIVRFWYLPNGTRPETYMRTEVDQFRSLHPNITVVATMLDRDTAPARLSTAATSGTGPDVTQLNAAWVGRMTAAGALRAYSEPELNGLGGRAAFVPASWTATRLVGREEVTAVPWFVEPRAIVYRTDVLSRLGLDPATALATWNSLEQTLARIKKDGKLAALGQPGKNDWNVVANMAPFIWAAGGDLLSADGTRSRVGSPAAVAGIDYYQRLVARYGSLEMLGKNTDDAADAFAAGVTAMTIQNPAAVLKYRFDPAHPGLRAGWSTAPMPAGPKGRFTFLGGSDLSIWNGSANADAAYEWVRFLTGRESEARYAARTAGLWPARTSATDFTPMATDPVYRAFADTLADARQYPAVAAWVDIEAALQKDFGVIWDAVTATSAPMPRDRLQNLLDQSDMHVRVAIEQPR